MAGVVGSLIRSLDAAVRTGLPTTLVVQGMGTVSVYPRQHRYVSDVQDWDSVYAAEPGAIQVSPSTWVAPPEHAQPLEELQWRLAWHDALQEPAGDIGCALLHLVSWPNLTYLPPELIEPVARICALLWRKPTVAYLIARIAGVPAEHVACIVRVLQMFGHVAGPIGGAPAQTNEGVAAAEAEGVEPIAPTTATRFLRRLRGLGGR